MQHLGGWTHDCQTTFLNYFENLYCCPARVNRTTFLDCLRDLIVSYLSQNDINYLNMPFIVFNIKNIVFQIDAFKASSIDGKLGLFYQKFWDIMDDDMISSSFSFL